MTFVHAQKEAEQRTAPSYGRLEKHALHRIRLADFPRGEESPFLDTWTSCSCHSAQSSSTLAEFQGERTTCRIHRPCVPREVRHSRKKTPGDVLTRPEPSPCCCLTLTCCKPTLLQAGPPSPGPSSTRDMPQGRSRTAPAVRTWNGTSPHTRRTCWSWPRTLPC